MAWDSSKPASAEAKSLAPAQIQANWAVLEDWLNDLGNFPTTPAAFNAGINAWTLIQTQTAAASATIDFTSGLSSTYTHYIFKLSDVIPATDNTDLWLRVSQSAVFLSGASDYGHSRFGNADGGAVGVAGTATDTKIVIANALGNSTSESLAATIQFSNPAGTAVFKNFLFDVFYYTATPSTSRLSGAGQLRLNNTAIDGVRFMMSAGNITSGTFALYGVRKT